MKLVNLLPERHRPAAPSGGRSGSAYLVLGALGAVLLGALLYAFTAHQASSRAAEAADVAAEASEAEAEAARLAPFGDFHAVMDTRVASVSQLAQARIDWERLTRELAHLLPQSTRLMSFEGSTTPAAATTGTTTPTSTTATGPSVVLAGCAESQPSVARTLVRLRRLEGAEDVTLEESGRDGDAAAVASTSSVASGDCGSGYSFSATVHLSPVTADAQGLETSEKVPVSLGGGP